MTYRDEHIPITSVEIFPASGNLVPPSSQPKSKKTPRRVSINSLLDRITDRVRHIRLAELNDVDDTKLIDAITALRLIENMQTELAFTGKVRKLPE